MARLNDCDAALCTAPHEFVQLGCDAILSVLERLSGRDLCACACTCKELNSIAHDDALWLPFLSTLPSRWVHSRQELRGSSEGIWRYVLRVRHGLFGAWRKFDDHRQGHMSYLRCIGFTVSLSNPTRSLADCWSGETRPSGALLSYRLQYGTICEMVILEATRDGGLSHAVYKAVAEQIVALSANPKSTVPDDLHMSIREIYKKCYPGDWGRSGAWRVASTSATASSQSKGSARDRSRAGSTLLSKSTTKVPRPIPSSTRLRDEEARQLLDSWHEFIFLAQH
jgi:hypothetical protein